MCFQLFPLQEFPLNSRHPGLRREEGMSRAAGHMPLWLDPGVRGMEARFYAQARANKHICSELGVHFFEESEKIALGTPRHPQGTQGTLKGTLI